MDEIHSEEFQNLDLNEQKRICCASLDANEDYLNLGDIDEDAWGIDEITKKYNEIFYSWVWSFNARFNASKRYAYLVGKNKLLKILL